MVITELAVSGVGRFRLRHVVRGLGPGLNLLCAPNEAGKSTIFRALRAGLFYRHGSTDREIATLASSGAQLPVTVEVGFEHAGAAYRVHKSFLFNRGSRLFKAGQQVAEGRVADEQVWSILGLEPGGRSADEATFGVLWVRQGASFEPVEISDNARSTLSRVVETQVGEVLGGKRGERVRAAIARYLGQEETPTGQPKAGGNWKTARERAQSTGAQLQDVRATLAALDADLRMLAAKLEEKQKLDDPLAVAHMHADLATESQLQAAADAARHTAEAADAEVNRLRPTFELAEGKHRELLEIDARISSWRRQSAELAAALQDMQPDSDQGARTVEALRRELSDLADQLSAAASECDRISKLFQAAASARQVNEIRTRLDRARELQDGIAELSAAIAERGLSGPALQRIEESARILTTRKACLEAKAPRVVVQLGPEAGCRVRLQGNVIQRSINAAVLDPTRIEIENIASVEVVPVSASADVQALSDAQASLEAELRKARVSSVAEARQRRATTERMEDERRGLSAELSSIAPNADGQDGVAVLDRALHTARQNMAAACGEHPEAPVLLEELGMRRQEAEARREECRRRRDEREMSLRSAQTEAAVHGARITAMRNELSRLEADLRGEIERYPDHRRGSELARLGAAMEQARRELAAAEDKAAQLRAAVPSEQERAAISARVIRRRRAIEEQQIASQQLALDIAGLRERIAVRGGSGLGEREAGLADETGVAERELMRIERQVAAWRMLRDTIDSCCAEARDTFLSPVKTAMKPFLHRLFPGADTCLDENFGVESLQRAELESFDYLSHGTREQISVLVRLGLGRLLAERGQPVPILLDDALAFSDDDRIERMSEALSQAAETNQVIVLTCRSRLFQSFGGRRLQIALDGASTPVL
ncbi:MAG TPA: AAA family ATPase [Xanthobacteraceae bacterium]|jgi:hypothetical protein